MPCAKIKYFNIILLKYNTLKYESIFSSFHRRWYLLYIHLDSQSALELKNDKYKNYKYYESGIGIRHICIYCSEL